MMNWLVFFELAVVASTTGPLRKTETTFDFPETATEREHGWSMSTRCGQSAIAGSDKDQREDKQCPNVLIIYSDDMAWGDLSINNPSKLMPTPNIDHLVSKGINFRDGHACSARCGPSRYCLLNGRHHWRRGDYTSTPLTMDYGRKILSHLFKRNSYNTFLVGKSQPVGSVMGHHGEDKTDKFYISGTGQWAFDQSFTSISYCCVTGGGYFLNDEAVQPFDHYALFTEFRDANIGNGELVSQQLVDNFLENPENFHLLDGYTVDGNPASELRPTTYMAYWTAIKNGYGSGLNDSRRRRRNSSGHRFRRDTNRPVDHVIHEGEEHGKPSGDKNYARFQEKSTGRVIVANYKLDGVADERGRPTYEFAADGKTYPTKKAADAAKAVMLEEIKATHGSKSTLYKTMVKAKPNISQKDFDSKTTMHLHHHHATKFITDHVQTSNPVKLDGEERVAGENKPFFMYVPFRAPHAPHSHNMTAEEVADFFPYAIGGKPSEQVGLFDRYIGKLMKTLHDLKVADNTLVIYTSDNGPDAPIFDQYNKYGHIRTAMLRGKKAAVYEGGHRVPMVMWWPNGIHRALHGTNFDLPVTQADFFATFADILDYPLPDGDACVYSYNSDNAAVHNQIASRIGRPGLQPSHQNSRFPASKWLKDMKTWNWNDASKTIFDATLVSRTQSDKAGFVKEVQALGPDRIETWLTKEEATGFILGWEGCIAEDSQSFMAAFNAHVVSTVHRNNKKYHQFENDLTAVPTKLMTGKLADMSIRLGRYKLIRYNAPKDARTGPNRQHIVDHEGALWHKASETERCNYNKNGKLANPGCTVEPLCRKHTSFGETYCMRDHYYQLFDLETNFGEKMFCEESNSDTEAYSELSGALGLVDRNTFTMAKQKYITDPWGYSLGSETTLAALWPNDCCVLNLDEKPDDWSRSPEASFVGPKPFVVDVREAGTGNSCAQKRLDRNGDEMSGGRCMYRAAKAKIYGETYAEFLAFANKEQTKSIDKKKYDENFGWTAETHFNLPSEENYKPGYLCSKVLKSIPHHSRDVKKNQFIWDDNFNGGSWRHTTIVDQLCNPDDTTAPQTTAKPTAKPTTKPSTPGPSTPEPSTPEPKQFNLGCKVPSHNGPLGEGWEANKQYSESINKDRRTNSAVADGELDPNEFGEWTAFATCLKNVIFLVEGQAYFKETMTVNAKEHRYHVDTNLKPIVDDGTTNGATVENDTILAGGKVGSSGYAASISQGLFNKINNSNESRSFHGAGLRYNENKDGTDALILECVKFLPEHVKNNDALLPMSIQPNFDVDMSLLGWYQNNTEGTTKELVVEGANADGTPIYGDDRTVQKYYFKVDGEYPHAFTPEF